MKLALVIVILAGCGGDKPAAQTPVANQQTRQAQPAAAPTPADDDRMRAQREADAAVKAADAAKAKMDQLTRDMDALNSRIDAAVNAVVNAQTDAERTAGAQRLKQLQFEQSEMRQRVQEAKEAAMRAERAKGVKVSPECLDNPLAKGC